MLPTRIGAFDWASTRGAPSVDANTAPAPTELCMKARRETRQPGVFFFSMAALPRPVIW